MPKSIEISAPLKTSHVVAITFDANKGFLVATQKANGHMSRQRALRDRTRSGVAGVRDFIMSKVRASGTDLSRNLHSFCSFYFSFCFRPKSIVKNVKCALWLRAF
jgi:hypothetical protein